MKKLIFILTLTLIFISCSNDENDKIYKSEGVIIGLDIALCPCCGGYIIEIEKTSYRFFDEFPKDSNLNLDNLPLNVKLDWDVKPEACDNFITISAIKSID